jgi:septum formation protein
MLEAAGVTFSSMPADVDEDALRQRHKDAAPDELARILAMAKAAAVLALAPQATVIGSDQILECDGEIFTKPGSPEGVTATLLKLMGRTHRLISAVVVVGARQQPWHHVDLAKLRMRPLSSQFISKYVACEGIAVQSSVGAYHIEGFGIRLFDEIAGDHFTIQGMPLLPLLGELRRRGLIDD